MLNKSNSKPHSYDHEEGSYPEEPSQSKFLPAFCSFCPVHEYKLMLLKQIEISYPLFTAEIEILTSKI